MQYFLAISVSVIFITFTQVHSQLPGGGAGGLGGLTSILGGAGGTGGGASPLAGIMELFQGGGLSSNPNPTSWNNQHRCTNNLQNNCNPNQCNSVTFKCQQDNDCNQNQRCCYKTCCLRQCMRAN